MWSDYASTPTALDHYTYTYDKTGNRLTRGNALHTALSQVYGYDGLDQLTSAQRGGSTTQSWTLDGLGNWNSFNDGSTTQTRGTNAANEITSTSTGLFTPTYDKAGNMTSTPKPSSPTNSWTVTYDAWNRVVSTSDGTTTVSYQYDGTGRRTERIVSGTAEHFYYAGQQVVETRLPDGVGGLAPEHQYVWSLQYVDTPILRDSYSSGALVSGSRLYYLTDANHNVAAVTNASGAVQERYDYDAYGKVTIYNAAWSSTLTTSAVGNTLLFAGQDVDPTTGLQYARARWYNSIVGGFVSRDRIGFAGGDLNLYRYATDNPFRFVDPSGNASLTVEGAYDTLLSQLDKLGEIPGGSHLSLPRLDATLARTSIESSEDGFVAKAEAGFTYFRDDLGIELPEWIKRPASTTPEQSKRWNSWVDAVRKHEQGHCQIERELEDKFNKLFGKRSLSSDAKPTKAEALQDLRQKFNELSNDRLNEFQRAIDAAHEDYHKTNGTHTYYQDYLK